MKQLLILLLFTIGFNQVGFGQDSKKQTSDKKLIVVYGSDECHHCTDTKAFLKEHKIEFVFYDIDKNPEALQEMLGKLRSAGISTSNLGIPVVDKHGTIFTNNGIFEEFLNKLK